MFAIAKRLGIVTVSVVLAVSVVLPGEAPVKAQGLYGARYCQGGDEVFWFVHASDIHVGTSGSTDTDNLRWLVTTARSRINPLFTVVTGDLTDGTNGGLFPDGQHIEEWQAYRGVLDAEGVTPDTYFDLPGNHDAYEDASFVYYKTYALQGAAYSRDGQVAWTKDLDFGKYHFVGVNTADNTGASFSIFSPYGDRAGLDGAELSKLSASLSANASTSRLMFTFGHHPVSSTGSSTDTYLYYGAQQFVGSLDSYGVLGYDYGHVHDNVETFFTGNSYTGFIAPGIRYSRVDSLGKDSPFGIRVVSVDCDGVNSVFQPYDTWPVVLITAPVNRYVGSAANPYAYAVPKSPANPIRALVFDEGDVASVEFRIDGSTWYSMTRVTESGPQWAGTWDASAAALGEHTIEVKAVGTTTRSHTIKVAVTEPNRAPVANDDAGFSTPANKPLTVAAPGVLSNDADPDGNAMTAAVVTAPTMGTLALGTNGGFTYTPLASAAPGTDTFTYHVSDGSLWSNTAIVTITLTPASTSDTVTITSATWARRTRTLAVKATSSGAPTAKLTVTGFGEMSYDTRKKVYTYSKAAVDNPGSVTVTSTMGGSATKAVTTK